MAIVSLSKAAELTGKSKSTLDNDLKKGTLKATKDDKNVWKIDTDDLFALYPEKEQQKCERLENELEESKKTILELENQLKNEISKREELELLLEKIDATTRKTNIVLGNNSNDHVSAFLAQHIEKIIDLLELFSSTDNPEISPSICIRLMANYNSELERFKSRKGYYKDRCDTNPSLKSDAQDAEFEEFVYSITHNAVFDYITTEKIPRGVTYCNSLNKSITDSWVLYNFKFT